MPERNDTQAKLCTSNMSGGKGISKIWITGKSSVTLIFEKEIAHKYGLLDSSDVTLQPLKEGILIKKSVVS